MNQDHAEALLLLAQAAGETDAESATMTAIDRLGFHLRLQAASAYTGPGSPFRGKSGHAAEVRTVLIEMVQRGDNGFCYRFSKTNSLAYQVKLLR